LKKEVSVGGLREYPVTSAPSLFSHMDNHPPLKPVCPVINTFYQSKNRAHFQTFQGATPVSHNSFN